MKTAPAIKLEVTEVMSMQVRKPAARRRGKQATAPSNGIVADPGNDPQIVRMAIAEVQGREIERRSMIAEAAYYRAEKRGFEPGHALDDWLAAELDVANQQRRTILSPFD